MGTMNETYKTKETPASRKRFGRIAVILSAVLLLLAAALMIWSCIQASACSVIFPNTRINGIDVGGLSPAQAEQLLKQDVHNEYAGKSIDLILPNGRTLAVSAERAGAGPDWDTALDAAYSRGRKHGTVGAGAVYLISHVFKTNLSAEYALQHEEYVYALISEAAGAVDQRMQTSISRVTPTELRITKGVTGLTLDRNALYQQVAQSFSHADFSPISVSPVVSPFPDLDLSAIWLNIHATPQDAFFDREARAIHPHISGVSFDLAACDRILKQAAEGSVVTIPLVFTDPKLTKSDLEALLFRDVLGSCKTYVGGTDNRVSNVTLAASFVNNTILMPGDIFSYNDIVGTRTIERGFLPAPAYVRGKTVDEIGGGICQVSSSAYLAALRANMRIVERFPHMYAVGYVPDGMDATIYFGLIDFRFQNNTAYPIRITTHLSNRQFILSIHGTKLDDLTVKITNKQTSFDQYATLYQADDTVALGEETVDVTGYSGRQVEVYRNLYSEGGTLLSSTLESVNTYKRRDKVILVHPEDPRLASPAGNMDPPSSPAAAEPGGLPAE